MPGQHHRRHATRTLPVDIMNSDNTIMALLETFQECKKRGESATLFLETRNGDEFATLNVKLPRTPDETFLGSAKKK